MDHLTKSELSRSFLQESVAPTPIVPTIDLPRFLRQFQMREAQLMWLLGAGASRAAGIKTAWDMIWDFKQKLYCSQKKLPLSHITDVSDPAVQRKLQAHFDATHQFPASGTEEEYSAYFNATYPSPKDRRRYLEGALNDAKPSFGHRALALLIKEGLTRTVWTTNFDRLIEDAVAKVFDSTAKLVVADLGEPEKLTRAKQEGRWPTLAKLHGDFHSEHIKNTSKELRHQDEEMRATFVQACSSSGLAIVGYSGRDASIMSALADAIADGRGFPGGLFWFKRGGETTFSNVSNFMQIAVNAGIEAAFVEVETFDELMSDVVRFHPTTSRNVELIGASDRPRLGKAPVRPAGNALPVVRTNALPIISWPTSCRLASCDIGGTSEVLAAIVAADSDIVAARVRAGVLAFGRDAELRRTFEGRNLQNLESYAISPSRFRYESGERTLIRDALLRALSQVPGLEVSRRGRKNLLFAANSVDVSIFNQGHKSLDALSGTLSTTSIRWRETCEVRLDWRMSRLWLLLNPRTELLIDEGEPESSVAKAREFVRERSAQRRNRETNSILEGWISLIVGAGESRRLRSFGISDGIDADFEVGRVTAFSARANP